MQTYSGHCLCHAVTWAAAGDTLRNLVCHCESCQRATSAPFTAFLGFNPDQVTWTGDINHYESSLDTYRGFCPTCGSRLYFRSTRWPTEIHIHASTLDNPQNYRPDREVLHTERLSWLDDLHRIPKHDDFGIAPAKS